MGGEIRDRSLAAFRRRLGRICRARRLVREFIRVAAPSPEDFTDSKADVADVQAANGRPVRVMDCRANGRTLFLVPLARAARPSSSLAEGGRVPRGGEEGRLERRQGGGRFAVFLLEFGIGQGNPPPIPASIR